MQPSGPPRDRGAGGFGGKLLPEPYDSFMRSHLRYYGYFQAPRALEPVSGQDRWVPSARGQGTSVPSVQHRRSPGDPRDLFTLPWAQGPLPAPRWPIECEVIKEPIEHIEWVPPEPEPFCPPAGPARPLAPLSEDQGTVVYQLSPAPPGSCFTRARIGGSPGPLSLPATPLEGPQDTTLIFESRFESGNLQKAVKVGPFEYVLWLRPDLYTAKHTQWFYFRVQNTRRDHLYRFTIANLAKPKSLYNEGMRPLLYSQRDAESCGIGWRRVGTDIRYYRRGAEEPAAFCLSWTARFPHDGDTCFFAHSYPYTYSDLRRYLRALCRDPARSRLCTVRALCRSLAGNTVYLLTIGSPAAAAGKRVVVLSARAHPGESGGSWAMRGLLDFLLSADADAQLLRRLFDFMVVPMLNPDGVVVGNSRCSLAGRDPNRAYGTARGGSFPGVWHLRAMVERVLAEREVVLYCDFHGHSRKNNVFMYGCDGGGAGSGSRLRQRVFPLMLSKNAPDKFSFPSCKFKVQKSKAGTGRVVMWRLGVLHSYTMEAAFGGSTLGGRNSHFTVQDLKSLGSQLCDTLLDFCDPDPAKLQRCLAEVDALLRRRLRREPGCGGWSGVSPSELESSTSGSDTSVSDGPAVHLCGPEQPSEQRRRKRLRSRRARNALCQPDATVPPLMYVKVLVQVGYEPLPPTLGRNVFGRQVYQLPGLFAYAKHIVKVDGRAGLFKGLTPRLCSSAIGTVVHSKVLQRYQEAEQAEPGSSKKEPVSSLEQVLKETSREMVARSAATLITHPFHVITLRCMVQFIGRETKYSGTLSAFATIYREEGILGFFAGLIPRLLGDILSLWLCNMLAYLINTYALENGASTMTEMKSYSQAVTGFFASMLTYPFVLVSNLMAVNNCGLAGGLLPYAPTYSSWLDCWSQLHREGNMSRGNSLFFRKVPAGKRYVWDERRFR